MKQSVMKHEEKKISPLSQHELSQYAALRPIYASEGQFLNQFIWANYYDTSYIATGSSLFFLINVRKERCTMMPYCSQEAIPEAFQFLCDYFHKELGKPLTLYLADESFVAALRSSIPGIEERFSIMEDRDCFDYIYEAERLRTLSGKAYHKKKNHVNAFLKEYGTRYEYRSLSCKNTAEIEAFHQRWLDERDVADRYHSIRSEEAGIKQIFENCQDIDCRIGGIYIDGSLEAYSIGSFNPRTKYAYIHVEKANPDCRGLYPFINQQFLIQEFPDALFVNREDDLGQEGLRKSKLSYKPVRLEKKFAIIEHSQ